MDYSYEIQMLMDKVNKLEREVERLNSVCVRVNDQVVVTYPSEDFVEQQMGIWKQNYCKIKDITTR